MKPSPSLGAPRSGEEALGDLVEELAARLQAGDADDVEAWIAAQGDHAERLRLLLPTVRVMAELGSAPGSAPPPGTEDLQVPNVLGGFRIIREVGRGGMGVVYEAEQVALGRRVALKVLPFAATLDPRQQQRFRNEARAAAGLHHTNIVPVYAVGCERGVHFYAMQLIDGLSLAELIAQRRGGLPSEGPTPAGAEAAGAATTVPPAARETSAAPPDAAYFRRAAEWGIQAAEALDCAHSLGVVHRDVKPANLLVDAGGRLWVTDFGLAQIQSDARLTLTGDLVGTLRYMSPEQALAQRVVVDHRADVYSLGATLYELLTLRPAFPSNDRQELLRQIGSEESQAPRRINPAIPAELETIVLKAMEKNPADRYATAQELADDLRRLLEDRPIRAQRPSLVQRARKWVRRHRVAVAAALICLVVTLVALVGSISWILGERTARGREAEAKVLEALGTAEPVLQRGNPWDSALMSATQRAEAQLSTEVVGPALRARIKQLLRDRDMLARLEEARLQAAGGGKGSAFDLDGADRLYAETFAWYGLDVTALGPQKAAERLRASAVCTHLVAGLDDWAAIKDVLKPRGGVQLHIAADRADDQRWRRQLRRATMRGDRAALEALAQDEKVLSQLPANLVLLGRTLKNIGSLAAAERLLRRAQPRYRADFWINFELASTLNGKKPPDLAEAARFYQAALALRPQSPVVCVNLGTALKELGKLVEAEAAFRQAIELKPDYPEAHNNLGAALNAQGKSAAAVKAFRKAIKLKYDYPTTHRNLGGALFDLGQPDKAVVEFRKAMRLDPKDVLARINLGAALVQMGKLKDAIAELRKATRLDPRNATVCMNLGNALEKQGQLDEAIGQYRRALRVDPKYANAHFGLGNALKAKGDVDGAIQEYRLALDIDPRLAPVHYNLGNTLLFAKHDVDAAIREYRLAIASDPRDADAYTNLGLALRKKGRLDECIAAYRQAIQLAPQDAVVRAHLGEVLRVQGRWADAIAVFREAIHLKKDFAEAYCNLGLALHHQGRFVDALAALKRGHELGSRRADWRYPSGQLVREAEEAVDLDRKLSAILDRRGKPADAVEGLNLARLCQQPYKRLYAASASFYAAAFKAQPQLAEDLAKGYRYDAVCAAALAGGGQGEDGAPLDEPRRASWRRQALDWLRADLAAYRRLLEEEPDKARPLVSKRMQHWQKDTDLAGVRGAETLARLPEDERLSWQQLWADVADMQARAEGKAAAQKKSAAK
jgi:serine/threonine protein kinase/Flp pilus assembly protein TadD